MTIPNRKFSYTIVEKTYAVSDIILARDEDDARRIIKYARCIEESEDECLIIHEVFGPLYQVVVEKGDSRIMVRLIARDAYNACEKASVINFGADVISVVRLDRPEPFGDEFVRMWA